MYFKTKEEALAHGLRLAGLTVDAAALIEAARARGDDLPGLKFWNSITGQGFMGRPGWAFERSELASLKALVGSLKADTSKPSRKSEKEARA